ncbi:MAG: rhomboid family protein [Phycisphaerae bacterium]|nr:rhomboid family protein [Phycisphaerae bacterium]
MQDELQQLVSSQGEGPSLAHRRCDNHADREAAARCPECGRFFCRECVTEHAGRVICADCLATMTSGADSKRWSPRMLAPYAAAIVGMLVAWMAYYYMGRFFLGLPHEFHEGIMW